MSQLTSFAGFTFEERNERWARVRSGMAEAGLDLLIALPESNAADVRYLSQEMGAVLFPVDDEPWILLGGEDSHLAVERDGWITRRESATPGGSTRVPYGAAVAAKLEAIGGGYKRVGIAGLDGNSYTNVRSADGYVVYKTVAAIMQALEGAEVVDASPVMAAARYVKSESEISLWTASVEVAEAVAQAIGEAFVEGAPQADAYSAGMGKLFSYPGVGTLFGVAWCPGLWGKPRPRLTFTPPGIISRGLCVATEIFPVFQGYGAQVAEPFVCGDVTAEQQEVFAINVAAFNAACGAMKPGTTWREVKAATLAAADGTDWTVSFLLHSLLDGPLFIPSDTHEDVLDHVVQANTTFVLKPTVFPSDRTTVVARSHDLTWGDSVVVRADGAQRLGTRPPVLKSY